MFAQSYSGIFDHRLKCEHAALGICKIYAICMIPWWRCFKINHRQGHFIIYIFYVPSQFQRCGTIIFLSIPLNEMQNLQATYWLPWLVFYIFAQVKFSSVRWLTTWVGDTSLSWPSKGCCLSEWVPGPHSSIYFLVNNMGRHSYLEIAPLCNMNLSSALLQLRPKNLRCLVLASYLG